MPDPTEVEAECHLSKLSAALGRLQSLCNWGSHPNLPEEYERIDNIPSIGVLSGIGTVVTKKGKKPFQLIGFNLYMAMYSTFVDKCNNQVYLGYGRVKSATL
ncbi:hypothetical protein AcV5_010528 [Taiwanofungus camphoratus]|nr:hypothetical protein AcV5_010528 [Antrodia cinnamomea]KAI0953921.1 hypothetical protein AcV7_010431 [Antrodia cinnamomea]